MPTTRRFPELPPVLQAELDALAALLAQTFQERRAQAAAEAGFADQSHMGRHFRRAFGVDTADAMNSRGYGLRGRTAYSDYRLEGRDRIMLVLLGAGILAVVVVAWGVRGATVVFFPLFQMDAGSPAAIALYVCWTLICASPLAVGLREDAVWRSSRSRV